MLVAIISITKHRTMSIPSLAPASRATQQEPVLTDKYAGERCVVPTPVPAEHKLTAVWKLSKAPSKKSVT